MSTLFVARSDKNKLTPTKGQTLEAFLEAHGLKGKLDDVGLYNWGTKDKAAINRALIERVGCEKVDDANPLKSVLDPALAPGKVIHKPEPWTSGALAVEKTHTVTIRKRVPVTAAAITDLPAWFNPESETCAIKYRLEGAAARADQADVEVHVAAVEESGKLATTYYERKVGNHGYLVDSPCGTENESELGVTHIVQDHKDSVAPGEQTFTWDGKSQAKAGVLKNSAKINSSCAPYSVLVRYYKDRNDRKAKITLKPFYPRWRVKKGGTYQLVDTSMVVQWENAGDNGKLKAGQIRVVNKSGDVVFHAALDESQLRLKKYDLLTDAVKKWSAADVKREDLPYRVQIQAHSDETVEKPLALAVMPTMVRACDYKNVQFIALNIRPGGKYMGDADHDKDIKARCDAMKEAIGLAFGKAAPAADTLKLFMAPEFYFRGPEGAYPVEKIGEIVPQLREDTDHIKYADWLFVFGSAIGYHKHESVGGQPLVHGEDAHKVNITSAAPKEVSVDVTTIPKVGWGLLQTGTRVAITSVTEVAKGKYKLGFAAGAFSAGDAETLEPALELVTQKSATEIQVRSKTCARIPEGSVGGTMWKVRQGTDADVTKCEAVPTKLHEYTLTLASALNVDVSKPLLLVEPVSTEIFNVALVQKGWPAPHMGDGSLRHVAIYKEAISSIDFTNSAADWSKPEQRLIKIHGTPSRAVLPTSGAKEKLGASPNVTRSSTSTAGSEINKSGLGGGIVFTVDGITLGCEVCLDHAENRLSNFYAGGVKADDPEIQVHLIPSWGMSIGRGNLCSPKHTGLTFNVDGSRCDSVAAVRDTTWRCDDHLDQSGAAGAACTVENKRYYCGQCSTSVASKPGKCDVHTAVTLQEYYVCGAPKYADCSSSCAPYCANLVHLGRTGIYLCTACGQWKLVGVSCGCPAPSPILMKCDNWYAGPACNKCGSSERKCNTMFREVGAVIKPSHGPLWVGKSGGGTHFERKGAVFVFPPKPVPPPDVH